MSGTGVIVFFLGLAIIIGGISYIFVGVVMPADIAYSNEFGSDFTMMTSGASTLVGPESIQDYLMRAWNNMNSTFDMSRARDIYTSPFPWAQIKENSLAAQNSFFVSCNQSLYMRQAAVESAIASGTYVNDPVQTALNQTRVELNVYGGVDWALKPAWYLTYHPLAYWSALGYAAFAIIGCVVAYIGVKLSTRYS